MFQCPSEVSVYSKSLCVDCEVEARKGSVSEHPRHLATVQARRKRWFPPFCPATLVIEVTMPLGAALSDDYVAELLRKDAKAVSSRSSSLGNGGLTGKRYDIDSAFAMVALTFQDLQGPHRS